MYITIFLFDFFYKKVTLKKCNLSYENQNDFSGKSIIDRDLRFFHDKLPGLFYVVLHFENRESLINASKMCLLFKGFIKIVRTVYFALLELKL